MLRPLYRFVKSKNEREFEQLYSKWGNCKRFTEHKVRFLSYTFIVPDVPSFVWQFKEMFVDKMYKFESNKDAPLIYDCGANIGMSVLYFKTIFPKARIKAFEADPKICKYLKENIKRNNINNVEIVNKAIWIDNDGVEFNSEGADGGSIYGSLNKKIKVKSIKLQDLLKNEIEVDMLKMDIEGAEVDIFNNLKDVLKSIKNIFVEYHSWNDQKQRLNELLEVLTKNNFRYFIKSVSKRKYPFINKTENQDMDLQLNIFAYKVY